MLTLGDIIKLLLVVAALGYGGRNWLKEVEKEVAEYAIEAHRRGYVNLVELQKRLTTAPAGTTDWCSIHSTLAASSYISLSA